MADDLGSAVLRITVEDGAARDRLRDLKAEIQSVAREARAISGGSTNPRSSVRGSLRQVGSPAFSARGARQGGSREGILTLERAQNRRFQIAQRIERLEERGANVSRLRARLGDATTAQAQRQFGTFRQITNELQRQVKLSEARAAREDRIAQALARQARIGGPRESILGRRGLTGSPADIAFLARQGGPRSPIGGALTIPDSPRFLEAARRAGEAQARAFQAEIGRAARAGGARSPIGGAVDIPGSPAFLAAQRRFAAQELSRSAAIGGPRSPIGGSLTIPDSPRFLEAARRAGEAQARAFQAEIGRAARAGGARSPVGGAVDIPGSPVFLEAQRRLAAQELSRAAAIGGPRSPIGGTPLLTGSPAAIRAEERLAQARQRATQAAEKATLAEGRRIGRLNVSPVRGGAAFPGSPAFLDAALPPLPSGFFQRQIQQRQQALRRRQDITSNALIGGAFPLLFGQGLGASLGGAAGGGLGGAVGGQFGFGLSLLGTAVGAQFDAIIQKATLLGQALDNPIKNFAALQQGALLSSKGLERQVESLLAVGREAEAAALIQQDLARSYGGAEAAKSLAASQDQLNRSWTQLSVGLAQLGLPVLAVAATDAANSLTGFIAVLQRISNLQLPEAPTRLPTGGEIAGGAFRVGRASAGGGAAGFFSAVGTEVLSFLGVNRPNAPTSPQAATSQTAAAESRRNALLSAQYRLITAQVQGYKDLSLAAEKQVSLEQEREDIANLQARGLKADDPQIERRRAQGAQERFKIEEEQGKLQRDTAAKALKDEKDRAQAARETAAAYQLISAESQIQLRAVERQIRDAQALGAAPAGPVRDTLRTRQQAASEIAAARDRVLQLGAQIDTARLIGDETGAARLVAEQQTAAKSVELSLTTGATALRDAAQQLRDSALETQRSLENLRGGNLEFLSPRDQQALLESLRAQAAPEAFRRGITLRQGGGIESEVNLLNRFLNFSRSESQLLEQGTQITAALEVANRPLIVSNDTLGTNLTALTTSVNNLSAKNWSVQVDVNGTSATLLGDVNGALV